MLALLRAKARLVLPYWPWIALVASALVLGAAHYAQRVEGLPPCILCLRQREPYWAALAIAAVAIGGRFTPWRHRIERLACAALTIAFLYGLGLALYHLGVEAKWWEGPKACASGGRASVADIEAMLSGKKIRIVRCEDPTYWPLPGLITMAGWNAIISFKLALWSAAAAIWGRKP